MEREREGESRGSEYTWNIEFGSGVTGGEEA